MRELGKAHSQVPTCDERSGNALLLFLPVLSSSRGLWQIPCSSPTPCPQAWTPGSQAHAFLLSSNDTVLRAIWGLGPVPGLAPMFYKALPSEDPACGRRGKQASKQARQITCTHSDMEIAGSGGPHRGMHVRISWDPHAWGVQDGVARGVGMDHRTS